MPLLSVIGVNGCLPLFVEPPSTRRARMEALGQLGKGGFGRVLAARRQVPAHPYNSLAHMYPAITPNLPPPASAHAVASLSHNAPL